MLTGEGADDAQPLCQAAHGLATRAIPTFVTHHFVLFGTDLLRASRIPGSNHGHGENRGGLGGRFARLRNRVECFLARSTERQADHRIRCRYEAEWFPLLGEDIYT